MLLSGELPDTLHELRFVITRLKYLLGLSDEQVSDLSDEQVKTLAAPADRVLYLKAKRRLEEAEHKARRLARHMEMLQARSTTQICKLMLEDWEKCVQEALNMDTSKLRSDDLKAHAAKLQQLANRGLQIDPDSDLVQAAFDACEKCMAQVARKQRLKVCAVRTFSRVLAMCKFKAPLAKSVEEDSSHVGNNLARMLRECSDWEGKFSIDDASHALRTLESLLDASNVMHGDDIDPGLKAKAEALAADLSSRLQRVAWCKERSQAVQAHVSELFTLARFKDDKGRPRSQEWKERLIKGLEATEEVAEEANDILKSWPKGSGSQDKDLSTNLIDTRESMYWALEILNYGPVYLGCSEEDCATASLLDLLPVFTAMKRLKEMQPHPAIPTLRLLMGLRLHKNQKLHKDNTSVATLLEVKTWLEDLRVDEQMAAERLHQLIEPFTFAGLRRLLQCPNVTQLCAA